MRRRPNIDGPGLKTQQFEFLGRSGDVIHLGDTQFAAPQTYVSLCRELKVADVFDLEVLAHERQFLNNRREKNLCLIVEVDDVYTLISKIKKMLGNEGIRHLFIESLMGSLSIFNQGEATAAYIEKTGYSFEIKLVKRWSDKIHRTELGKVPLLRNVF